MPSSSLRGPRRSAAALLGAIGWVVLPLGCSPSSGPNGGSESHFLGSCALGCGDLECICGVCTKPCSNDGNCSGLAPSARCSEPPSACGAAAATSCDVPCENGTDCTDLGAGATCVGGRCRVLTPDTDDLPLTIVQVMVLQPPECRSRPDPNAFSLSRGRLDVRFTNRYSATLLIRNDGAAGDGFTLRQARVVVDGDEHTAPVSGFLDDEGRRILTVVDLVPPPIVHDVAAGLDLGQARTLTTEVQLFAEAIDGRTVGSQVFTFPVEACAGCLIAHPPEVDDPSRPGFQCTLGSLAGPADSPPIESPCLFGQDAPIDCRLCCSSFGGAPDYDRICACDTGL